jgi:hypothetical protein
VSLNFFCKGVGGISGCLIGGVITQYFRAIYSFFCYSWMALVIMGFAIILTEEVEKDQAEFLDVNERLDSSSEE